MLPGSIDCENVENGTLSRGNFHDEPSNWQKIRRIGARPSNSAREIQNIFCDYFNNEGSVPWQNDMCNYH
jgi:hypothetical protein